jgi:hypothetical protein
LISSSPQTGQVGKGLVLTGAAPFIASCAIKILHLSVISAYFSFAASAVESLLGG